MRNTLYTTVVVFLWDTNQAIYLPNTRKKRRATMTVQTDKKVCLVLIEVDLID